jgi:histidinol-phosphatase
MRGVPLFGTLIGIERDGELQVGVVSAPALGSRWYARRGGGAWALDRGPSGSLAPRRIAVSKVASVPDMQVLYGSALDVTSSGKAPGFDALIADAWRDRGFGDFWGYTLVAEGAAEAMVETDLSSWDIGCTVGRGRRGPAGRMTTFDGRRTIHERSALATNGVLHDEVSRGYRGRPRPRLGQRIAVSRRWLGRTQGHARRHSGAGLDWYATPGPA